MQIDKGNLRYVQRLQLFITKCRLAHLQGQPITAYGALQQELLHPWCLPETVLAMTYTQVGTMHANFVSDLADGSV